MAKEKSLNTGIILVLTYFVLFVVNSLVVFVANSLFPHQVVLGTQYISFSWAFVHAVGVLSLVDTFAIPFFHEKERLLGRVLTSKEWMIGYLVLNFVAVWGVTRFAEQFGLGISSWWVGLILALVLDMAQGLAMMKLEKLRTS